MPYSSVHSTSVEANGSIDSQPHVAMANGKFSDLYIQSDARVAIELDGTRHEVETSQYAETATLEEEFTMLRAYLELEQLWNAAYLKPISGSRSSAI